MSKRPRVDTADTVAPFDLQMRKLCALNKINVEILNRLPGEQFGGWYNEKTFRFPRIETVKFKNNKLVICRSVVDSTIEITSAFYENRLKPNVAKVDSAEYLDELDDVLNHKSERSMDILNEVMNSLEKVQTRLEKVEQEYTSAQQFDAYLKELGFQIEDKDEKTTYHCKQSKECKSQANASFKFDVPSITLAPQVLCRCLDALCDIYRLRYRHPTWLFTTRFFGTTVFDDYKTLRVDGTHNNTIAIGSRTCGSYALKIHNTDGVSVGFSELPVTQQNNDESVPWIIYYHITSGFIDVNTKYAHSGPEPKHFKLVDPEKVRVLVERNGNAVVFHIRDHTFQEQTIRVKADIPTDVTVYPIIRFSAQHNHRMQFLDHLDWVGSKKKKSRKREDVFDFDEMGDSEYGFIDSSDNEFDSD